MELAKEVVAGVLKATIVLLMLSIGLKAARRDLLLLWDRPRLLAGCVIAAFFVVPVAAYALFRALPLTFAGKAGLWVAAITPGAPMIYRRSARLELANPSLAASFQVTMALLVIVFAPMWLAIIGALSGSDYWTPPTVAARQVATVELVPIALGLAIHHWLPGFGDRAGDMLSRIGNAVLVADIVVLLVFFGPRVAAQAEGWRILAAFLLAAAAIASGHALAGPDFGNRVTIANANAQRNAGLALAIVAWNLPQQKGATVTVVVTYVIVAYATASIYSAVCRRLHRRGLPSYPTETA